MKAVEYWSWKLASETTGRRATCRWKMTREQALGRDPSAEPIPGTMEVRHLPETTEEGDALLFSRSQSTPDPGGRGSP